MIRDFNSLVRRFTAPTRISICLVVVVDIVQTFQDVEISDEIDFADLVPEALCPIVPRKFNDDKEIVLNLMRFE